MELGQHLAPEQINLRHHIAVGQAGLLEGEVHHADAALVVIGAQLP